MTKPRFTTQAVEDHYEELRQFIRQRTGSPAMAEEVVQETWIRASTTTTAVLPDNPRAYIYRMAGNLAIDHVRRQQAHERYEHNKDHGDEDSNGFNPDQVASPAPALVETLIAQHELAALNAAVRELPDKCRDVFLLYRGQGLSMKEVAGRLGISEKTVEKHIARAMVHCRKRLREAGRQV